MRIKGFGWCLVSVVACVLGAPTVLAAEDGAAQGTVAAEVPWCASLAEVQAREGRAADEVTGPPVTLGEAEFVLAKFVQPSGSLLFRAYSFEGGRLVQYLEVHREDVSSVALLGQVIEAVGGTIDYGTGRITASDGSLWHVVVNEDRLVRLIASLGPDSPCEDPGD